MTQAIRAAEVEAVLSARDQMSQVLTHISESSTHLHEVLGLLGSSIDFSPGATAAMQKGLHGILDTAEQVRAQVADIPAKLDPSGVTAGINALHDAGSAAAQLRGATNDIMMHIDASMAGEATKVLHTNAAAAHEVQAAVGSIVAHVDASSADTATAQLHQVAGAAHEAQAALSSVGGGGFTSSIGAATEHVGGLHSALSGVVATAGGFMAAQVGMMVGGKAFGMIKGAAIDLNSSLETSTLQFTTLMGNADAARKHVLDLFTFAKVTPFETAPVINASRIMRTFGGDVLDTQKNLYMVGDAAAATSSDIGEVAFWTSRAYAAMQGGKPYGEATMRLMELGIMAPQTATKLNDMQAAGKSGAEQWAVMTGSMSKFTGAMNAQANTWTGLTSSLSDAFNLTMASALQPFFKMAEQGVNSLLTVLGDPAIGTGAQHIADSITSGATAMMPVLGAVAGVIGAVFGGVITVLGPVASLVGATVTDINSTLTHMASTAGVVSGPFETMGGVLGTVFANIAGISGDVFEPLLNAGAALDQIVPLLVGLFGSLAGTAAGLIGPFQQLMVIWGVVVSSEITDVLVTLRSVIATLIPHVEQFAAKLAAFAVSVIPMVSAGLQMAGTVFHALGEAVQGIAPHFGALMDKVMPLISAIGRILVPVLQILFNVLGVVLPPAIAILGFLIGATFDQMAQGAGYLTLVINFIADLIGWLVEAVPAIVDAAQAFGSFVGMIIGAVGSALGVVGAFVGSVLGWFNTMGSGVTGTTSGFLDTLGGIWNSFVGVLGTVAGVIGGILAAMWEPIRTALVIVTFVVVGIVSLWLWLQETLLGIVAAIVAPIVGFFAGLAASVMGVVMPFISGLIGIWNTVVGAIVAIVGDFIAAEIAGWTRLIGFIIGIVTTVATWLTGTWTAVTTAVAVIIAGLVTQVVAFFLDLWNKVSGFVGGLVRDVMNFFTPLVTNILGALGNAWNALGKWGADLIGGFLSSVQAAWTGVTSWLGGVAGMLIKSVGDLASTFVGLGGDLIMGLVNGITSNAGKLISAIHDHVIGNIPQPIRDALGIKSPSTVAADIMGDFVLGMVGGANDNAFRIAQAAAGLADTVTKNAVPATAAVDMAVQAQAANIAGAQAVDQGQVGPGGGQGSSTPDSMGPVQASEMLRWLQMMEAHLAGIARAAGSSSGVTAAAAVRRTA